MVEAELLGFVIYAVSTFVKTCFSLNVKILKQTQLFWKAIIYGIWAPPDALD